MAGGHHGRWGRVTEGKLREEGGAAINCHKTRLKGGKEGEGALAGAARAAAARIRAEQRKERGREEGEGGADRWDRLVSGSREKKKRQRGRGPLREKRKWAGGPKGKVR
jgi:hypothetical protein